MNVGIIDYGVGNIRSVTNALYRATGKEPALVSVPEEICKYDTILMPGVGSFDYAVKLMDERCLREPIRDFFDSGRLVVGICLGMQLLMDSSEEGLPADGLGFIPGRVRKLQTTEFGITPVIGWYETCFNTDIIGTKGRYYFVHSYEAQPENKSNILGTYPAPVRHVTAAIKKDNAIGLQFHPEKSGSLGIQLLGELFC